MSRCYKYFQNIFLTETFIVKKRTQRKEKSLLHTKFGYEYQINNDDFIILRIKDVPYVYVDGPTHVHTYLLCAKDQIFCFETMHSVCVSLRNKHKRL